MVLGALGTFSEYALCLPGSAQRIPEGVSPTAAAGLLLQHYTAIAALEICGQLQSGERVLIHAAAGKIGQVMVRLAKHLGAEVFATASTAEKLEVAERLGADHPINYTETDFAQAVHRMTEKTGVDLIIDTVGGDVLRKSLEAIRPYGRVVIAGNASNEPVAFTHYDLLSRYRCALVTLELGTMIVKRPDLMKRVRSRFGELFERGVFEAREPSQFPLEDGPQVLERLAARQQMGAAVLVP